MPSPKASVAIIILNWNGRKVLPLILPALFDLAYENYRIVLADNGSTDDSLSFVRTQFPDVTIISLGQNYGFSKGINEAVRRLEAQEEILIFLNNDVVVRSGWLAQLVKPFDEPQVGITGPKLLFPDERTIQHAGAELIYPVAYSNHYYYKELDRGQADEGREVPYVTGASLAIRRSLFEELGFFDEQFAPFYFEEVDLCYRAKEASFKVLYVPEAVAIHYEGHSFEGLSASREWMFQRNRLRFVLKHYSPAQFLEEFVPAEIERLERSPASINDLIVLRQAYLDTLLSLPEIIVQADKREKLAKIQQALVRLLQEVLLKEPTAPPVTLESAALEQLHQQQHIDEPSFSSEVAVIGPAIAAFRESWNYVSTKWYVRAIIQQQEAFNKLAARLLKEQDIRTKAVASDISTLAEEILLLKQQIETLTDGLDALENSMKRVDR